MKTTAKITKIINNFEDSIQLLRDEPVDAEGEIQKIQELIDHFRSIRKPFLENLESSASSLRENGRRLRGGPRIEFFKSWSLPQSSKEILHGIIQSYVNWEFPCLEVFPGEGQTLPVMVGAEPLYVADWDDSIINIVSQQFNEFYSTKRLMKYVIKGYDLSDLPQDSFGFVCCLNWLRFENNAGLNKLARSVLGCLMPGGTFLFTFNPNDKAFGVLNMEEGYAAGADSQQLAKDMTEMGFEVVDVRTDTTVCYMLVKKPGTIRTIKHSSILGKVIDKSSEI